MASSSNLIIILKALALLSVAFPATAARPMMAHSASAQKAEAGEGSDHSECLETMFQLQSCTGEVILFFMNGETYLGPNCCRAIRTVEHKCWPSIMFGSIGFTAEESDILRGYCDAEDGRLGADVDDDASHACPSSSPSHHVNLTFDDNESLSP